jgi:hypothetical protein
MSLRTPLAAALALLGLAAPGLAAAACPQIPAPALGVDAELLELEGPLQAVDPVGRTITVLGTCVDVPVGMLLDTSGDGVGDITLEQLAATTPRTALGGTIALTGAGVVAPGGLISYAADAIYFEFAEHVVVGPLLNFDAAAGTFLVGGTTVRMNTDPRVPADVIDAGANVISFADLADAIGTSVTVEGYFEGGVLYAKIVETELILTEPGVDAVAITRADFRAARGELEVRGQTTPQEVTGFVTTTVTLDVQCDGLDLVAVPVTPNADAPGGIFTYRSPRNRFPASSTRVCVTSPLGGADERALSIR